MYNNDMMDFPIHWHKEIEILFVREGELISCVKNQEFLTQPGDLIIIESGELHFFRTPQNNNSVIQCLIFDPDMIIDVYKPGCFQPRLLKSGILAVKGLKDYINFVFDHLSSETILRSDTYEAMQNNSAVFVRTTLTQLWITLLRCFDRQPLDSYASNKAYEIHYNFRKVLDYINNHSSEDINSDYLAGMMHYSKNHFLTVFKKYTGMNITRYIKQIRINRAKELLTKTEMKVTEISSECGFDSIRTFNRVFKQIAKTTPNEIRNK